MKTFFAVIGFIFFVCTLGIAFVLWKIRRRMHEIRDAMKEQMNDEAFQRMANKYYDRDHSNDGPQFSDDYFKGEGTGAPKEKQQQQQQQQTTRRTTHTAGGVTIIDDRDPNRADRKIFNHDEGEYVDFKEV